MKLYDLKVKDNKDKEFLLGYLKGKALLIVNTATRCGLTPQYDELEKLYEELKRSDFEILDFPCNQFLEQAPEDDQEIEQFCKMNYNTNFLRFKKIDVNGENADELYRFLKEVQPVDLKNEMSDEFEKKVAQYTPGISEEDIKWNFTKFLVDKEGNVVKRYSPVYSIDEIKKDIMKLL